MRIRYGIDDGKRLNYMWCMCEASCICMRYTFLFITYAFLDLRSQKLEDRAGFHFAIGVAR